MNTSHWSITREKLSADGRTIYLYPLVMGTARISIGNSYGFDDNF